MSCLPCSEKHANLKMPQNYASWNSAEISEASETPKTDILRHSECDGFNHFARLSPNRAWRSA